MYFRDEGRSKNGNKGQDRCPKRSGAAIDWTVNTQGIHPFRDKQRSKIRCYAEGNRIATALRKLKSNVLNSLKNTNIIGINLI